MTTARRISAIDIRNPILWLSRFRFICLSACCMYSLMMVHLLNSVWRHCGALPMVFAKTLLLQCANNDPRIRTMKLMLVTLTLIV